MQQLTLIPQTLSQPKLQLRDYQKRVIAEIYAWYRSGKKSVMLVSATGSGKTLTAVHIIKDAIARNCRVLFIVHREPLIDQTVNTLRAYGIPSEQIGYIKAGYPQATDQELVVVASVQTLARRDYPEGIGLVIFDETQTTSFWESSQQLITHYAGSPVLALSKVKFLHLTATPFRTKPKEYFPHIEAIVRAPDIGELILMGYLVLARHFGYGGLIDLTKLDVGSDGDYKQSQLNIVCAELEYNQEIVSKYLTICPGRKAIAFSAGVEQSVLLTKLFNQAGITTEHIQAETPHDIRRLIYARFKTGETQIISSVGTLTEGFDEPSVEAVILARPTRSTALLIQMCGRGLRLSPGKDDCFLLDFGDNFKRLGRIDKPRKISLCPTPPNPQETLKQCPSCHALINQFCHICPECGYIFPTGDKLELEDSFLKEFGELFDEETRSQITYIRAQRKARFTKRLPPDGLWDNWNEKYPQDILCNDWLYQAVFRGDTSQAAQQELLSYLYSFNPHPDHWVKFHMEREFVPPRKTSSGKYQRPPISLNLLNWWEVLRVDPLATKDEISRAYQHLAGVSQGDNDAINLLNWAFDQYHCAPNGTDQLKQNYQPENIIDWTDLIQKIDLGLKRKGWSVTQAKDYLLATYGVRSRLLLTDAQILDFWKFLKN